MSYATVNTTLIHAPAADVTLTAAMSGTIFICTPVTAGGNTRLININAPTTAGLHYRFVHAGTVANILAVTSTGANIRGIYMNADGVPTELAATSLGFTANANPGDYIEVFSDGANWYAKAMGTDAASFVVV